MWDRDSRPYFISFSLSAVQKDQKFFSECGPPNLWGHVWPKSQHFYIGPSCCCCCLGYTYDPRFVEKVVDGVECVDAWNAAVVQCEDDVFPVVGGVARVLPNEHQVRLKTPARNTR